MVLCDGAHSTISYRESRPDTNWPPLSTMAPRPPAVPREYPQHTQRGNGGAPRCPSPGGSYPGTSHTPGQKPAVPDWKGIKAGGGKTGRRHLWVYPQSHNYEAAAAVRQGPVTKGSGRVCSRRRMTIKAPPPPGSSAGSLPARPACGPLLLRGERKGRWLFLTRAALR